MTRGSLQTSLIAFTGSAGVAFLLPELFITQFQILAEAFQSGVAIVAGSLILYVIEEQFISINNRSFNFAGTMLKKREAFVVVVGLFILSSIAAGFLHQQFLRWFESTRIFKITLGLSITGIFAFINREVSWWNQWDRSPLMWAVIGQFIVLVVAPVFTMFS